MGACYAIVKWFTDLIRFLKILFEKTGLPRNYESVSLHAFIRYVHFTLPWEERLRFSSIRTSPNLIFNSAIPDRDKRYRAEIAS